MANGIKQYPAVLDAADSSKSRLPVVLDTLSPGGAFLSLYYGDGNYSNSRDWLPMDSSSDNGNWVYSAFSSNLTATSASYELFSEAEPVSYTAGWTNWTVVPYPVSGIGGWLNASGFTVSATSGVMACYRGAMIRTPLGISSVSYSYSYFRRYGSVPAAFGPYILYPEFQVYDLSNGDPASGTGLIFSHPVTALPQTGRTITHAIFNDGTALASQYVTSLGMIENLHQNAAPPYPAYPAQLSIAAATLDNTDAWFTVNRVAISPAYPLAPVVSAENPKYPSIGTWTSPVLDLGGRPGGKGIVQIQASVPAGTSVGFATRTSSDGVAFSPVSIEQAGGSQILSANSRYLKVVVYLHSTSNASTPVVQSVSVSYDDTAASEEVIGYPNPYWPDQGGYFIVDRLPGTGGVNVSILDGGLSLVRGLNQAGDFRYIGPNRRALWDGRNSQGEAVAPGLYYWRAFGDQGNLGSGVLIIQRDSH
jgi:hypothetical protein